MIFVDTNILVYASGIHAEAPEKTRIARQIMAVETGLAVSVQVLQEFLVQATRRSRPVSISKGEAVALIASWRRFSVQPISLEVFDLAVSLRDRLNYSYWDRAIVAAALILGCERLLSEDMQDGQLIESLRIENPFGASR